MYLLQVITSDFSLQLKTEVTASTIEELQYLAVRMVKSNPCVIGLDYVVARYVKTGGGGMQSETLKTGKVKG